MSILRLFEGTLSEVLGSVSDTTGKTNAGPPGSFVVGDNYFQLSPVPSVVTADVPASAITHNTMLILDGTVGHTINLPLGTPGFVVHISNISETEGTDLSPHWIIQPAMTNKISDLMVEETLILDYNNRTFTMIYANVDQGWQIIGQN